MADDVLSYAAPVPADPPQTVMRDGDLIVALHDAVFPPRCIYCNKPTTHIYRVKWGDASFRITSFISRHHFVFLCDEHIRERRLRTLRRGWPMLPGLLGLLAAAPLADAGVSAPGGVSVATLLGIVSGALLCLGILRVNDSLKLLTVKKVESRAVYLDGASPAFVESLPPLQVAGEERDLSGSAAPSANCREITMEQNVIPYASPAPSDPPNAVVRYGDLVRANHGATFPERCVFCNAPMVRQYALYWNSTREGTFRLVRESHRSVKVGLCRDHVAARRRKVWIAAWPALVGLVGFVLAIVMMRMSDPSDPGRGKWVVGPLIVAAPMAVIGLLRLNDFQKILKVERVGSAAAFLSGAGPAFVESLPPAEASPEPRF